MSEQEFENWLALLSGLLKLSPQQRNNIADELRSHLEERMEDLIDAGSSREEAIAAALEEFGDTAALAHHFTSIAHQKRRRRLMRYTYGTIAAVTCAILALATFWPRPDGQVMPNVAAQSEPDEAENGSSALGADLPAEAKAFDRKASDPFAGSREKIEAKLAQPCEAKYFQMPLREVLDDLSVQLEIAIVFDPVEVGDIIDPDVPVNFQIGPNTMSGKTLLGDFILAPLDLVYTIRENFVLISSYDKSLTEYEIVVYDCRDLVATMPADLPGGGDQGFSSGGDYESAAGFGAGGSAGASEMAGTSDHTARERQLIEAIFSSIRSEDSPWDDGTGTTDENIGTISAINGLLVVRQTRAVHDQVERLLELLRERMKERD